MVISMTVLSCRSRKLHHSSQTSLEHQSSHVVVHFSIINTSVLITSSLVVVYNKHGTTGMTVTNISPKRTRNIRNMYKLFVCLFV